MFRQTNFDKLLDKATSHLLMETDWKTILQICDLIRQNDIQPKNALQAVKKKMTSTNPYTAMYAVQVLESMVKNCGSSLHDELATRQYCESLHEIVKTTQHEEVRQKMLELIQAWNFAFRKNPKYSPLKDIMNTMKAEGHKFPTMRESDAMFSADSAPVWADGEVCHRCRAQFTLVNRKHHCRACGQVFCNQCSSKQSTLPKFGIEKEVRVCDACFDEVNKPSSSNAGKDIDMEEYLRSSLAQQSQEDLEDKGENNRICYVRDRVSDQYSTKPSPYPSLVTTLSHSKKEETSNRKVVESLKNTDDTKVGKHDSFVKHVADELNNMPPEMAPPRKTEDEIREEEELQLAIALSQSEAEHKEKEKMRATSAYFNYKAEIPSARQADRSPSPPEQNTNPELAHYLNRSYWESKQNDIIEPVTSSSPSAPATAPSITTSSVKSRENGIAYNEIEEFVKTLRSQVEIFINRMKSDSSRGRSIATDSSVQTLFMNITAMHSKLLRYIQQHDDSRLHYERLQDKLTQVKDARAALDALRDEHREKVRRQAEEAERQRQMLMAQKLDIMRKKKQEYLQYQRQVALQRIQEQEREMQMRQEQQKQQYMNPQYFMGSPIHGQQFASNPAQSINSYPYQFNMMSQPTQPNHPPMGHPPGSMPHQMQGPSNFPPQNIQPGMSGIQQHPISLPPGIAAPHNMSMGLPQQQNISQNPNMPPHQPQNLLPPANMPPNMNMPPNPNMGPNHNMPQNQNIPPNPVNMPPNANIPPTGSMPPPIHLPPAGNNPNPNNPNVPNQIIQSNMGPIQQIPPQGMNMGNMQFPPHQQPGAPPSSPQKNEKADTAELISFD